MVSEVGSVADIPETPEIPNHDYEVWNAAYEKGYANGRDYEAKMHSGLELTMSEVQAIRNLSLSIGYISHEEHETFIMLLKRLDDVQGL